MLNNLLSVDVGWGTTAFAHFENECKMPIVCEISYSAKCQETRFKEYLDYFQSILWAFSPKIVIIEGVENWQGSFKSRTAAARQDTIKLAYLVGAYKALCARENIESLILTAREWKGQLSKEATRKRVERIFQKKMLCSEHIIDAIAIGLSRDGELWNLQKKICFRKNKTK